MYSHRNAWASLHLLGHLTQFSLHQDELIESLLAAKHAREAQ
jgi:hypothetical protein